MLTVRQVAGVGNINIRAGTHKRLYTGQLVARRVDLLDLSDGRTIIVDLLISVSD